MQNRENLTPAVPKPLYQSSPKFAWMIKSEYPRNTPNVIQIGWKVSFTCTHDFAWSWILYTMFKFSPWKIRLLRCGLSTNYFVHLFDTVHSTQYTHAFCYSVYRTVDVSSELRRTSLWCDNRALLWSVNARCPRQQPAVAGQHLHASVSTGNTLNTAQRLEATATVL